MRAPSVVASGGPKEQHVAGEMRSHSFGWELANQASNSNGNSNHHDNNLLLAQRRTNLTPMMK